MGRVDHDAEGADPTTDLVDRRAEGSKAGGGIILNLGGLSISGIDERFRMSHYR